MLREAAPMGDLERVMSWAVGLSFPGCLRTGRALRKPRRKGTERRGRISGMVSISERPAEVEDRAVPGHWEGDLILGKNGRSAIGTLVERSSRFLILLHLAQDHSAAAVAEAMIAATQRLPQTLWRP